MNAAILPLATTTLSFDVYLLHFGKSLTVGMFTSSFLPYLMPFGGFIY